MKLKKIKLKTRQLLQFHAIKTRIYEQKLKKKSLDILPEIDIELVLLKLKQTIQIIYKFHKKQKKILFIGVPELIEKKINLDTCHTAVPNMFKLTGY